MSLQLNFNAAAMEKITVGGKYDKVRVGSKDGVLRLRPTDRKIGAPMVEITARTSQRGGAVVEIDEGLESTLGLSGYIPGAKLTIVDDKYSWLAVPVTEGSKTTGVSVSRRG
jgi:hypothetical protein